MEANNNLYGEIINSKFTQLLSADVNNTWPGMKALLDKELPEKKKKKWLFWFTTKIGIIAIVLFTLFASAASVYIGFIHEKQETTTAAPSKGIKINSPVQQHDVKEPVMISVDAQAQINTRIAKKISSPKTTLKVVAQPLEKLADAPATTIKLELAEDSKEALVKNITGTPVKAKDSVVVPVDRRRAF